MCTYEEPRLSGNALQRSSKLPEQPERKSSPNGLGEVVPTSLVDASAVKRVPSTPACLPRPAIPSFAILPSVHFQTILRPLSLPLSVIPPERVQISLVAGNDLDMSMYVVSPGFGTLPGAGRTKAMFFCSRLRGLCRLNKLGVYFTHERREAILRGDSSNSMTNRHFVDAVQLMGLVLSRGSEQTPATVRMYARYVQKAWESLIQLKQTRQERDKALALEFLAHSYVIVGLTAGAQVYLLKACKIIEKENFGFLPEYGSPVEFSDQVREDASLLSQAIYLENYFYLALGGSAPAKTARLGREFRLNLQVRPIGHFFVVRLKTDLVARPSERTHFSSRYAL